MYCDWNQITSLAYLTILELNIAKFPIPAQKVKCKGVKISSYQKYSEITGVPISKITLGHESDDAFLLSGLRPNLTLILYDKEKYGPRMKHTLWHEIGHIKCGHKKHGEQEEIEAHFFAAQANAPNVIIKALAQRGYSINAKLLMDCFGISQEAADKKMFYLRKYSFEHKNEYDDLMLLQFSNFLNSEYPPNNRHFFDDYFEEMENNRQDWF